MRGVILLSVEETNRYKLILDAIEGSRTVAEVATLLGVSERHVKRLKKGVREHGAESLAHGNRGRRPANAKSQEIASLVVELATTDYRNTSCEHMSELLREHKDIDISAKSISRILKQAHISLRFAKRQPRRRRTRERKPREGMLVQCDASQYKWLDDRGPAMTLHGAIDDATGKVLALYFRPNEDLNGYMNMLKQMVERHGVPQALYSDRHTIHFSPLKDKLTLEEQLAGKKVALTKFGSALNELGIAHIAARSPQAKGRIERLWGTIQARLVAELRIAGINTIEEANAFLPTFMVRFNRRFAVKPKDESSALGAVPTADRLAIALSHKENRSANNGSDISVDGVLYQLIDKHGSVAGLRPGSKVQVLFGLDGALSALQGGERYILRPSPNTTKGEKEPKAVEKRKPYSPGTDHPWKQEQPKRARHRRSHVDRYFDENPWLNQALGDRDFDV